MPGRKLLIILLVSVLLIQACGQAAQPTADIPILATGKNSTSTVEPFIASETPATFLSKNLTSDLVGLDFDRFLDESFKILLLREPEWVTETGLADMLGVGNDQLNNLSLEYLLETQQLERDLLELLHQYDQEQLTTEQRTSAGVYDWYLQDRVDAQPFMDNDYPISVSIFGLQNTLVQLFTDLHPLRNEQDGQDYLARLDQVPTKFDQVIEGLERREAAGVVLPRFLMQSVISDIRSISAASATATPFYTAFAERLADLEGLSQEDRQALLAEAESRIDTSVIPAYQELEGFMEEQESRATNDPGVWKFPNGAEYYDYIVRHHTTTNLTPEEIHQLGLQEVERLQEEMKAAFQELGYPDGLELGEAFQRLAMDSGTLSGEQIVAENERIIQDAETNVEGVFDLLPNRDLVVVAVPEGGYYIAPAGDGSRPGVFYATAQGTQSRYELPTIAYHEAIPGHHFQLAIAQDLDLPLFRKVIQLNFLVEGWALYAEQLVDELGFYQDDPYGRLGRLQWEAFRAARLVVDTGIHRKKWTYDQAMDYMVKNTGQPGGYVSYEVARYIVIPGQALSYKIGMLEILKQRQRAQDTLGDQFDLKEFHNLLLGNASVPQAVLEQLVDEYIASK